MVRMVLICGVFLALFFSLVAFNFSVPFSRYNVWTCTFLRCLSTLVERFFGTL